MYQWRKSIIIFAWKASALGNKALTALRKYISPVAVAFVFCVFNKPGDKEEHKTGSLKPNQKK